MGILPGDEVVEPTKRNLDRLRFDNLIAGKNTHPAVRAAAVKAKAQWLKLRAKNAARSVTRGDTQSDLSNADMDWSMDSVREAYTKRNRDRQQARRNARAAKGLPPYSEGPDTDYRYVKEVHSNHVIVSGDGEKTFKVPYDVKKNGKFKFGTEEEVKQVYVPASDVNLSWDKWNQDHKKGPRQKAVDPATGAVAGYSGPAMKPETIAAIRAFQKSQGLPVTGNLDAATLKSAQNNPAQVQAAKDAKKAAADATREQKKAEAEQRKQAAAEAAVEKAKAAIAAQDQKDADSATTSAAKDNLTKAEAAAKDAVSTAKSGKLGVTGAVSFDKTGKGTNVVNSTYSDNVAKAKAAVKAAQDAISQRKSKEARDRAAATLAAAKAALAKVKK